MYTSFENENIEMLKEYAIFSPNIMIYVYFI